MNRPEASPHVANAIKERARLYLATVRELTERYGEEQAREGMSAVSGTLGAAVGETLAHLGPRDFAGLYDAFFLAPDDGATFKPDLRRLDHQCLEVKMMACPLKEAWREAGCGDQEICMLLRCASAYDRAVIDAAGFDYELTLWSPGEEGCCRSRVVARRRPT